MRKHAYLIMAHNEIELLKMLLSSIDDERNDIYIHIDKKLSSFNKNTLLDAVTRSKIYFVERLNVVWGDISQIECELNLLKKATNKHYDYYHLLSGQDLPIKTQDYIHNFFKANNGKEFVRFSSEKFSFEDRIRYYYFFIGKYGKPKDIKGLVLRLAEKISISIQKIIGINRIKNSHLQFQKGTQWFSITNDLAMYVVENSENILEQYKHTICSDEIFLQTLIINSTFKDNLYHKELDNDIHAMMRLIDWNRGTPYVFKEDDFEELKQSDMLFARKFSLDTDRKIVESITDYLKNS